MSDNKFPCGKRAEIGVYDDVGFKKDPQTCPNCGGRMECIHQSSDTWECDTCEYTVGEYVIGDYSNRFI